MKSLKSGLLLAAALVLPLCGAPPASAGRGVNVGSLNCTIEGGIGLMLGSSKGMDCVFHPARGGSRGHYVGSIKKLGIDIGVTNEAYVGWLVFAPGSIGHDALAGTYVGATAQATVPAGTRSQCSGWRLSEIHRAPAGERPGPDRPQHSRRHRLAEPRVHEVGGKLQIQSFLEPKVALPADGTRGSLVGRIWRPDVRGPSLVRLVGHEVIDITRTYPTCRDLCEQPDPAAALRGCAGERIGELADILANSEEDSRDPAKPYFLAPIDLQVIKAAGVTFAASLIERVIEEKAHGDAPLAQELRADVRALIGEDLSQLRPGSKEAMVLKSVLTAKGAWSQYLEVGIGPDAEVFTKAPVLSSVGTGACAGLHPHSDWNNPEPEVVVTVASTGRIVGAMLGNDVNLRDVEGRSALLLGKAKDNNASAALGPFLRLFDRTYSLAELGGEKVTLAVHGPEGFSLEGASSMKLISRTPEDLVKQTIGPHHQYPDGFVLYLGTMFAPIEDREGQGRGFTHKTGDVVTVAARGLGTLANTMRPSDACAPWTFGVGDLMRNLVRRNLLRPS